MSKLLFAALCSVTTLAGPVGAQNSSDPLNPTAMQHLEKFLQLPSAESTQATNLRNRIWRETALSHGRVEPLLRELQSRLRSASEPKTEQRPTELRLLRLLAHFQRRLGETGLARRTLDKIKIQEETVADTLSKAEVLDAMGRNKAAIEVYDRLLKSEIRDDLRNRILLRRALMNSGPGNTPPATPRAKPRGKRAESPLARFARGENIGAELRNQAAVVLALTGEQAAAIKLFEPSGEGTARFRQELRSAEWAIEAKALPEAQESAWNAVRFANLKRDRRYALAVLVEAYRRAGKLDELVTRLATTENLDAESRQVWIDLLRERGKVEAALNLFRSAKAGDFTTDMRRELLEICRETNQDETLEKTYLSLVKAEPRFLEWRKGLTSFYLERGRRDEATAVWRDYLAVTEDIRYRMAAASALTELGLDDLAVEFARKCMTTGDLVAKQSSLLFLFELHHSRGRLEWAKKVLEELDKIAPADGGVRKELADAHERLGDLNQSVAILRGLQSALGDRMTPDTRMKLALMLSKIGAEEAALEQWQSLWLQTNSIPRRRYVEERLMAVASRLGKLAKMAIALERKLIAGAADDREAGLLVRLYIKVNDPVSATEIIEEHMRRTGKKRVDVLTEKARVFQSCQDYYNYEKVVQELLIADPEGRPDYLRQLAMSMMERGQRKEARDVLKQMKADKTDSVSDEFEAGVLALAGMREEALQAYRRGIARSPERIDIYLLMSNMQRSLGLHNRSAGMFQYLTANAEKDDLFTIAVDGILNMRAANNNAGAPDRLVEWTRRVVLERLASRPDKLYLYRLVADLSEELNDSATAIRALKAAVPVAGEQRTQMLRELMAMAKKAAGGNPRPTYRVLPSGMMVPSLPRQRSNPDLLMFGRRILGQAELVPPDVYIELGASFLAAGEVANAIKTFNQASRLPEFAEMRRRMAQAFEIAGYPDEALRVYERILSVENSDVELITKVGELREQTGSDAVALDLYRRGLRFLLDRSVFATTGNKAEEEPATPTSPFLFSMGNRNSDGWDRQHSWLMSGLLATLSDSTATEYLQAQHRSLAAELQRVNNERKSGRIEKGSRLSHHPRIERRLRVIHRVASAFRRLPLLEAVDREVLGVFDRDSQLLERFVTHRLSWGNLAAARKLVADISKPGELRTRLEFLTGASSTVGQSRAVSVAEAASMILPLLSDDTEAARRLLERVRLAPDDKTALEHIPMLVGATSFLNTPDLTLSFCRLWIDLSVRNSPGYLYQTVQAILQTGRRCLDKSQLQSLTEHVLTLVIEKPDKFTVFVQRLAQLRDTVGPNFLTRKQIENLIKSRLEANDRFIYGIEQMIVLLAPEDRAPVLRAIWNRLPKTQKAYFLVRLVIALDVEVEEDFEDFLVAGFRGSLGESDQKRSMGYQVEQLAMNAPVNYQLRLRFLDVLANDGMKTTSLAAARTALLFKLDKPEQAKKHLRTVMDALVFAKNGRDPTDPRASDTYTRLLTSLDAKIHRHVLAVYDDIEKARGRSPETVRKRISLRTQMGIQDDTVPILESAVEEFPKDAQFRSQLANALVARGSWRRALKIREAGLDPGKKSSALRNRLVADWKRLHHPIRALEIRGAGVSGRAPKRQPPAQEPPTRTPPATGAKPIRTKPTGLRRIPAGRTPVRLRPSKTVGAATRKNRQESPTIKAVKKFLKAKDEKKALAIFRQLWRTFSPTQADPYSRIMRSAVFGRFGPTGRLIWPPDPDKPAKKKTTEKKPVKPSRGGLPEIFTRALTKADHDRFRPRSRTAKKTEQVSAPSILVQTDAGRQEIQRLLRSLDPSLLGSAIAKDIYGAQVAFEVGNSNRDAVLERLLARERAGTSDKIDFGQLAVLLDDPDTGSKEQLAHHLSSMASNLNPRDQDQLRRLARLYARCGQPARAATFFQWCAVVRSAPSIGPIFFRQTVDDDLLNEARDTLEGEHRIRALDGILRLTDPGDYARDMHVTKVLRTWMDLLDPKQCLEQSRWALELAIQLDMRPMRGACKIAALVHARSGEADQAVRCLEIALCKLPLPKKTDYPHYLRQFESPGYLSDYDIAVLFPIGMVGFENPKAWLTKAKQSVLEWHAARRLPDRATLSLLAVLAIRLQELGQEDHAHEMLEPMIEAAGSSANKRLVAVDVCTLLGLSDRADSMERELFAQGQLNVERIPDLIARTIERDGPEAGFALGEQACDTTLHPKMLEHLIAAAEKSEDSSAKKKWQELAAEAAAARATLDPPKVKKAQTGDEKAGKAGGGKQNGTESGAASKTGKSRGKSE